MQGSGTVGDPWQITNFNDLELIGTGDYLLSHYYKLMDDIDASTTQDPSYNDGAGWLPIGDFRGGFNGNNKTINGLYINRPNTNLVGLFSEVGNVIIKDLTLNNVDITGHDKVGALVGGISISGGTLTNINIQGSITGRDYIGGMKGWSNNVNLTFHITNCNCNIIVTGRRYVGGMVGHDGYRNNPTKNNLTVEGTVTGTGSRIGGLCGRGVHSYSNITINANVIGVSENLSSYVGGVIADYTTHGNIDNAFVNGNIEGRDFVGGIVGRTGPGDFSSQITNSEYNGEITGRDKVGGIVGWFSYRGSLSDLNNVTAKGIIHATGDGIGGIAGSSCSNHTNIMIDDELSFDCEDSNYVGGIVGIPDNTIHFTDCIVSSDIKAKNGIGGIIGYLTTSTNDISIENCAYIGDLTGTSNVGGIVGYSDYSGANSKIDKCFSMGQITCSTDFAGGLAGVMRRPIINSYSMMDVSCPDHIGGLVGHANNCSITNSYSAGSIDDGVTNVGGMVGSHINGNATNSYWDTETSGQAESVLGLGRTTTEMTQGETETTFVDWDFEEIWGFYILKNDGYPFFLSFFPLTLINPNIAINTLEGINPDKISIASTINPEYGLLNNPGLPPAIHLSSHLFMNVCMNELVGIRPDIRIGDQTLNIPTIMENLTPGTSPHHIFYSMTTRPDRAGRIRNTFPRIRRNRGCRIRPRIWALIEAEEDALYWRKHPWEKHD